MLKLTWTYCYIFCMCFWFCLKLNNYLRIPPWDPPSVRMVMGGRGCGNIWTGIYHGCHLWRFYTSHLKKCWILKIWKNVLKKYVLTLEMPEGYRSPHCAGAWLMPNTTQCYSAWSRGRKYLWIWSKSCNRLANSAPMTNTVAKPENQPGAVSVIPTIKKKQWE